MKRIISLVCIVLLALSFAYAEPDQWAKEEVNGAINANMVPQAYQANYQKATTREEFCVVSMKMIEELYGTSIDQFLLGKGKNIAPEDTFSDCDNPYVLAAYSLGVTKGTGDGKFSPNLPLTREQAAVFLTETAYVCDFYVDTELKMEGTPQEVKQYYDNIFNDMSEVAPWARKGVIYVRDFDIMSGTGNGNFSPKAAYQRQQSFMTVYRLYSDIQEIRNHNSDNQANNSDAHSSDLLKEAKFIKQLSTEEALALLADYQYKDFKAEYQAVLTSYQNDGEQTDDYQMNIFLKKNGDGSYQMRGEMLYSELLSRITIYDGIKNLSYLRMEGYDYNADEAVEGNTIYPRPFTKEFVKSTMLANVGDDVTFRATLEELAGEKVLHLYVNEVGVRTSDYWLSLKTLMPVQAIIVVDSDNDYAIDEYILKSWNENKISDNSLFDSKKLADYKFKH